ncbi:MAG: PEP-CTERM sorting domain-containing protein [Verrucomicrobiaceae bacterium]
MKRLIKLSAAIAVVTSAQGASVTINNITGSGNDLAIGDLAGMPLGAGFVAIYTFSPGNVPSTAALLKANGVNGLLGIAPFDSTDGVNLNSPDPGAFTFDYTITNDSIRDLYVVLGNNSSVADATGLGLLNPSIQLDGDDTGSPTGDTATYNAEGGAEILIGTSARGDVNWSDTVGSSYNTNILTLEGVPEPSAALLSGIALFGLMIRRRG